MKKALISGISGQDGSYLSEFLLEKGYEVWGIVRRNSIPEHHDTRIAKLVDEGKIHTEYGDMLDPPSLSDIVCKVQPDEIYNLAAQSHVGISFRQPSFTVQTNALGVMNILEVMRQHAPHAKFYQASSSEMFGNSIDADGYQRLSTPMRPVSPYGCAKLFAHNTVRVYRESYGLFAVNGVLFNHESPRRGRNFVTQKIIKGALEIKAGRKEKLELGNLDSFRDWGHSKDYVRAMYLMLQRETPSDWLVATGESHSVRDLCHLVFSRLGMDYEKYVVVNPQFIRPNELDVLKGDASVTRQALGWKPEYTFEMLVNEMFYSYEDELGLKK